MAGGCFLKTQYEPGWEVPVRKMLLSLNNPRWMLLISSISTFCWWSERFLFPYHAVGLVFSGFVQSLAYRLSLLAPKSMGFRLWIWDQASVVRYLSVLFPVQRLSWCHSAGVPIISRIFLSLFHEFTSFIFTFPQNEKSAFHVPPIVHGIHQFPHVIKLLLCRLDKSVFVASLLIYFPHRSKWFCFSMNLSPVYKVTICHLISSYKNFYTICHETEDNLLHAAAPLPLQGSEGQ